MNTKLCIKSIASKLLVLLFTNNLFSQEIPLSNGYYVDALRYSQSSILGSSRIQGMGGVGVATGADISSGHLNPAGLGLLRKGEMSITGSIGSMASNTNYLGNTTPERGLYFGIPNMGIVFSNAKDDLQGGDFRGGSFSISFSKINNFQSQYSLDGINKSNSILDDLAQQGNIVGEDYLLRQLNDYKRFATDGFNDLVGAAYYSQTIDNASYDFVDSEGQIQKKVLPEILSNYLRNESGVSQSEFVRTKNGMYQWDFAYGGNYKDKLFFGFGLGITRINYRKESEYNELFKNQPLSKVSITDDYSARGTGVNLKGGVIYKPNDYMRLGFSFTTPSYMSINEIKEGDFSSVTTEGSQKLPLLQSINTFQLITPMKVAPGIAFFIGKKGFISADLEVLNYASANLINSPTQNFYKQDNIVIGKIYQTTTNFKIGAELRHDIFRLRTGYAFFGDPYKDGKVTPFSTGSGLDRSMNALTFGFGIRNSNMFIDLAVIRYFNNTSYYQIYNSVSESSINTPVGRVQLTYPGSAPIAEINSNLTNVNFTVGTFF